MATTPRKTAKKTRATKVAAEVKPKSVAKKATAIKSASQRKATTGAGKPAKTASPSPRATNVLTCLLDHGGANDRVQLTWKLDDTKTPGGEFHVSTEAIRECAAKIRAALSKLEAISAPFTTDSAEHKDALRDLATNGEALAKLALGGGDSRVGASAEFYKWFMTKVARASPGGYEILFIHKNLNTVGSRKFVAPWHLAFTPGAKINELPPTAEGFGRFWCLQYRLVAVTPGYVDTVRWDDPLKPNHTRISAVLEVGRDRVRGIDQRLNNKNDSPRPDGVVLPSELLNASSERRTNHRFNYIWLHPSGDGAFELNDEFVAYDYGDDFLDSGTIADADKAVSPEKFMLTMFDGDCILRDRTSWIEPLMRRLRGGLIAPETDIRLDRPRYFGWRFLKSMIVHPGSLSEAIVATRAHPDHWPRSLIYGFYCNARHVSVAKEPTAALLDLFQEVDAFISHNSEDEE